MGEASAIEVEGLSKVYERAGVRALDSVTFSVDDGEVFGFLGRNGAGKSTTVRILTTLIRPTEGRARVGGFDVVAQPAAVRGVLGAALQESALDELMTGREHLVLAARLVGVRRRTARERAAELLQTFGLVGAADRIAATYSGGMRRRLDVAMAMVRRPQVLFLDEPTTGLDPQGRRSLWALIRELRDQGSAVFLTTQYLAEADALSDRVAVVHDGRIAALGKADALKEEYGTTTVRMRVTRRQGLARATRGFAVVEEDGWTVITVPGGEAGVPALIATLQASGVEIERLHVVPPSLEDVFVRLTGTEIESTAGSGESGSVAAVRRGAGMAAATRGRG